MKKIVYYHINMRTKKTLTFLIIFLLSIKLFAIDNSVKLKGKVDSEQYTLKLYYEKSPGNLIPINDSYTVNDVNNEPFDLTKDGNTNLFHLKISGNQNNKVKVKLKSQFATTPFTPADDGTYNDDDIVPIYWEIDSYSTVPSGYLKDFEAWTFYYYWEGKADLTAGKYSTTVRITYNIN